MSFTIDLTKAVENAKGNIDRAVRETVLLCAQGLSDRSPVDTGRFRANWTLGIGEMDDKTTAEVDPTGARTALKVAEGVANGKAGQVFWITNSLPYAERLENGWSKQAPQGMVELTAIDVTNKLNRL